MTDDDKQDGEREGLRDGLRGGLKRSRQKVIGGVCGGLGRYFRMDPVIFRVVLTVLALAGGVGLVAYGIGWLLIPLDGEDETEVHRLLSGRIEGTALTAVLFTLVGSGLFLSTMDNGDSQAFSICLVAALVGAVYWSQRRRAVLAKAGPDGEAFAAASGQVSDAPPAAQPPPAQTPSWWRESTARSAGGSTGYLWGPDDTDHGPYERRASGGRKPPEAKDFEYGGFAKCRAPHEPGERSMFGAATFTLAVIAATAGVSLAWHHQPLGTIVEIGMVCALGVLGLGLVIGAFLGRRGRGTIFLAVLSCFLLAGAAALPKSVGTDWSRTTWRPMKTAQVRSSYQLGAGQGILDLTGLDLKGGTTATALEIGAGQLEVRVPQDATVEVHAKVGLGDIRFPDEAGGHNVDVSPGKERSVTLGPPGGARSSGTITLDLKVGVGEAVVLRGA